jgi:hypothetical protein
VNEDSIAKLMLFYDLWGKSGTDGFSKTEDGRVPHFDYIRLILSFNVIDYDQ